MIIFVYLYEKDIRSLFVKNPLICALRFDWLQGSQENVFSLLKEGAFESFFWRYSTNWVVFKHAAQKFQLSISCGLSGSYLDSALTIEVENFVLVFSREERLSIDEVIVDGSKTEHITLNSQTNIIHILDLEDFRSHKARSSAPDKDISRLVNVSGQTKINNFDHITVVRHNNVLRFDVPMHNSLLS